MMSNSTFTATPMNNSAPNASRSSEAASKPGSSFMQSLAASQRSPVAVKEHGAALSRKLSVKSNGSHASSDAAPGAITGGLSTIHQVEENVNRGRERGGSVSSASSVTEPINKYSLTKSNSEKSTKSVRSYQSLRGIGAFQVGSLRVHSPSPTRSSSEDTHPCLKAGDVFVVRDIPVGVVIGYDTKAITIEKEGRFEGFKSIGPGAHLIWASPRTDSVRTGYWIMTPKKTSEGFGEVIVKRWDKYNEVLDE
jgi:A1 cistron-splicing factor AAR2